MKTGNEILKRSLALMGETLSEDNEDMAERAVELINLVLSEVYELELSLQGISTQVNDEIPQIDSLKDNVYFKEPILYTLIPLGLAGYLLSEEEPERSSFYLQLYHTERELLRSRCRRSRRHKITRSF